MLIHDALGIRGIVSRPQKQFTGLPEVLTGHIDTSPDLGAIPGSMDSQDAAFWCFAPRVHRKIRRGWFTNGHILILTNDIS